MHTHTHTHDITSLRAPVGAKKDVFMIELIIGYASWTVNFKWHWHGNVMNKLSSDLLLYNWVIAAPMTATSQVKWGPFIHTILKIKILVTTWLSADTLDSKDLNSHY